MDDFVNDRKNAIIITIAILILGSVLYFKFGNAEMNLNYGIYNDMRFKVAYSPEGNMKVFVLARNNDLAMLKATSGNPIPESNSIVIGNSEAMMMQTEKLFSKPNDELKDFFGITPRIEGVLGMTNSPIDYFHFMASENFNKVQGDDSRIFMRFNDEEIPKLFYTYNKADKQPSVNLIEGNMSLYKIRKNNSEDYFPVLIGYNEAMVMKKEKLFSGPGDTIKGFFGKNIIIAGIIEKTNTSIDFMLFIPLFKGQI